VDAVDVAALRTLSSVDSAGAERCR